jgi:hypothetical protein
MRLRFDMLRVRSSFPMRLRQAAEAAFEVEGVGEHKFLLSAAEAGTVSEWAIANLCPDPYGDGPNGAYRVQSLYLDSPQLASYHRTPGEPVARFRIRRYGEERVVHLERKLRREAHVRKRRTAVPLEELAWLNGSQPPQGWEAAWFREECRRLGLQPVCEVSYRRHAWQGELEAEPVRVTLDRDIAASPQPRLKAPEVVQAAPPIWDGYILEVKCRAEIPASLRALVDNLSQSETRLSKYCRAVDRCGLGT